MSYQPIFGGKPHLLQRGAPIYGFEHLKKQYEEEEEEEEEELIKEDIEDEEEKTISDSNDTPYDGRSVGI